MRVVPESHFGNRLLAAEKPARYLGGEFGAIRKDDASFRVALSFPDLYEIGMSNQAIKILYAGLNGLEGVACERVFAPDLDFEAMLRETKTPLYCLESGMPLHETDIVAFSLGYELCGTSLLNILDLGGIPLLRARRGGEDPVVIAGGMALSNPLPFSDFLDAVWVGEAEAGFYALTERLRDRKAEGAGRDEILAEIASHPAMWCPGKKARRAVYAGFGASRSAGSLPVATIKPVQDHGVVEIMRGCPNGCRFCHAGYAYRPLRMKTPEIVFDEVLERYRVGGHREITLSSLSSGDYAGIDVLLDGLSKAFKDDLVSFQLPSLRVSSFSLPLLESICAVRKSGLTFAVETPKGEWQVGLNKDVDSDKILAILKEARQRGWKSAKFYFMIGLPLGGSPEEEISSIKDLLIDLQNASRMEFNVNIGVFVPKPHTPFERSGQLSEKKAFECFMSLKKSLPPRIRLSFHSPFISFLEGIISRGDERSGSLILKAFEKGIRLEAWEEHRNMEQWREILESAPAGYVEGIMAEKGEGQELPWSCVDMGLSGAFLKREFERSRSPEPSPICSESCAEPCGACNTVYGSIQPQVNFDAFNARLAEYQAGGTATRGKNRYRMLFFFSKKGKGRFYPHLTVIDALSKAFTRSLLPINYTEGFNPQPKLEIAHPLAMGVESSGEVGCVEVYETVDAETFTEVLNQKLPEGIEITHAALFPFDGVRKNISLASIFMASAFELEAPSGTMLEDLGRYPNVRKLETAEGRVSLIVLNGATKDEQALAPFKKVFGDDLSAWPIIRRIACLCGNRAADGETAVGYETYFSRYYSS
jgi:radical SAM superfamily enzyme YgiQ (UPF0313 family)